MTRVRPGKGGYNRLKTHCPRGHLYTPENTYVIPSSGGRVCRACDSERTVRRSTGYFVDGYRDKECPICHARWFVSVSIHAAKKHGERLPGMHPPVWWSEEESPLHGDRLARNRRWRRWAAAVREEQAIGGAYVKRLMRRWRLGRSAANYRLERLAAEGLITRPPPGWIRPLREERLTSHCRRGHPWTAENTQVDAKGRRNCRACWRIRAAKARQKAQAAAAKP